MNPLEQPYMLEAANWKTVKEAEYKVAVLHWGATEAHNYHLPYGTDNYNWLCLKTFVMCSLGMVLKSWYC